MTTLNQCNGSCGTIFPRMREKFENDELTDCVVKYGSEGQYSKGAHRIVLCSAADFFNNALFKHSMKENQQGVMKLPINDKEVAEAVLSSIYGAKYDDSGRLIHPLHFNIAVYEAADYIGIMDICRLATEKFQAAAIDELCAPNGCGLLISAMRVAYDRTHERDTFLRPLVTELCVGHAKLFSHPKMKPTLQENAEMATDIAYRLMHRSSGGAVSARRAHPVQDDYEDDSQ